MIAACRLLRATSSPPHPLALSYNILINLNPTQKSVGASFLQRNWSFVKRCASFWLNQCPRMGWVMWVGRDGAEGGQAPCLFPCV